MTLITVSATAPDAIVAMPGAPRVKRPRAGTGDDCPAGKSRAEPTPGRADGVVRGWRQPVVERQSVRQPQPGTALSGEGADGPGLPRVPVAKNGQDPRQRRAAGPDAGGRPRTRPAASRRGRGPPSIPHATSHGGLVAGPNAGEPARGVASGGRCVRELRSIPHATSHGGIGGGTERWAAGRGGRPGRSGQSANFGPDLLQRRTVELPSEPRVGEAGHGRRLGWPAQFANSGKNSMQRHPVGLVAGPSAGEPATDVAAGGGRNSRNLGQDPMRRRVVGLTLWTVCWAVVSGGGRRGSRRRRRGTESANSCNDPIERRPMAGWRRRSVRRRGRRADPESANSCNDPTERGVVSGAKLKGLVRAARPSPSSLRASTSPAKKSGRGVRGQNTARTPWRWDGKRGTTAGSLASGRPA